MDSAVGSSTGGVKRNAMDPEASQDRFLKLLVAQLNNQDPLNPMDNAQMTTQMAQINTVSGIQELNATLKGMAAQVMASQTLQGASLIGRDVLAEGNSLTFDGGVARGALSLDRPATQVHVDIIGSNGERVDTLNLGALGPGQHPFEWNPGALAAGAGMRFEIRAQSGGEPLAATPLTRVGVASVGLANGTLNVQLQNGQTLPYSEVRAFI
ncbi:MAG: flagellar hook assembly protein FlgD [Burkholderiales bacterium]|nr:MAG: flagellar hook assembly protein FlgD [Burkholderiales bacterium]